ncbi:MAG: histidine phosphatase family protein, partial [Actinomycetota bacterium]|nr:histidine phosphatase family protein [Actinomycetota bacterium]
MESAILVRHGESTFSARGLVNGRVEVRCPLSERGVAQARRLAAELADEEIDLCVTSALERTRETADIALAGRAVPRIVLTELNDPLYGSYEGGPLASYLEWALASDSAAEPPGGGESRQNVVSRYAGAFRTLLARREAVVLVVTHSLPIAYVVLALAGRDPAPRVPLVEHATAARFAAADLERAVARLEAWSVAPTW